MPRSGPRTVRAYSEAFKLTAVRLSQQPGIQVKTVAAALAIHPFMLSKWRKDVRDGRLQSSVIVKRSLCASRMNCSRSSIGAVSNQGTAHLALKRGAVQFRRSVTYVLGPMCYLCTRSIPPGV